MNINALDWDNIKFFIALSEYKNLTITAKHLNVQHTTVARRIDQLEGQLKLKLFNRLARGWMLTPEGQQLLEDIQPLREEFISLERKLKSLAEHISTIKLSAPVLVMNQFILPLLSNPLFNKINIELISSTDRKDIVNGEIDIALRIGEIDNINLTQKKLCNIEYAVYAHQSYNYNKNSSDLKFIVFSEYDMDKLNNQWLANITENSMIKINDMTVILSSVKKGLGLALLPKFIAEGESELVEIEINGIPKFRPLYLVMHSDVKLSPKIRAIADLIIGHFDNIKKDNHSISN